MRASEMSDMAMAWLAKVHSGSFAAADQTQLQRWLAESPAHREAFAQAEALWSLASGLEQDPASSLVRARSPGSTRMAAQRQRRFVFAAAAAVLLLALGLSAPWQSLFADAATGTAERRIVSLPDGSTITLDAASAIDVRYDDQARRVVLRQGDAYFDVAYAPRPFMVIVGDTTIHDLGTQFEVDRKLGGVVAVAVREHAVRVTAGSGVSTTLREGERLFVDAAGRSSAALPISMGSVARWRAGQLIAERETLGQVVDKLARYRRGWIFVSPDAARLSVSAVLDLDAPDKALQTLAAAMPIEVHHLTPYLIIVTRS